MLHVYVSGSAEIGGLTYCSCWNGLYPLCYRVGMHIVEAVLDYVTKPLSSYFRRLLTRTVRTPF